MIPAKLLTLIRRFEGLRLKPYRCPAGVATIGYGHTGRDVTMGMPPITLEEAESLLEQDATNFYLATGKLSPVLWLEGEGKHAAIADFCFNLGITRYKASTLKRRVDAGDWRGAHSELQKWIWGGGRRLSGLIARRAAEGTLLSST